MINIDWALAVTNGEMASSLAAEIGHLKAENAELRRQLDAARETLKMTATESERRLSGDLDRAAADRDRYRDIARAYLAAWDRLAATQESLGRYDLDAIPDSVFDAVRGANQDVESRLGDMRKAVLNREES